MQEEEDKYYLERCIALSRENMLRGTGGPFGAIIVKDGHILAESGNMVLVTSDPTAHAEVAAIRQACHHIHNFSLEGATLYSSCEPCPMCMSAIYWARISRLVFACSRDDAADAGFDDAFIYKELTLPLSERAIPMQQIVIPHCQIVFAEWKQMEGKRMY